MTVHWAADDPDTARDDCEPAWDENRPEITDLPDISEWQETTVTDHYEDDDYDEDQVACWHIEPGTPCDWNICRQPERLATGDTGADPALGLATPNLDRIRTMEQQ